MERRGRHRQEKTKIQRARGWGGRKEREGEGKGGGEAKKGDRGKQRERWEDSGKPRACDGKDPLGHKVEGAHGDLEGRA